MEKTSPVPRPATVSPRMNGLMRAPAENPQVTTVLSWRCLLPGMLPVLFTDPRTDFRDERRMVVPPLPTFGIYITDLPSVKQVLPNGFAQVMPWNRKDAPVTSATNGVRRLMSDPDTRSQGANEADRPSFPQCERPNSVQE